MKPEQFIYALLREHKTHIVNDANKKRVVLSKQ